MIELGNLKGDAKFSMSSRYCKNPDAVGVEMPGVGEGVLLDRYG